MTLYLCINNKWDRNYQVKAKLINPMTSKSLLIMTKFFGYQSVRLGYEETSMCIDTYDYM